MRIVIQTETFAVESHGFICEQKESKYVTKTLVGRVSQIEDLTNLEYGSAIIIDKQLKTIKFGRDYLGHFPLFFTTHKNYLCISDSFQEVVRWRKQQQAPITISKEAVTLFLFHGYIGQGHSMFNEITLANNASYFIWENNTIKRVKTFTLIDIVNNVKGNDLKLALEQSIDEYIKDQKSVKILCSGGLDSSIIAYESFKKIPTSLLTFSADYKQHEMNFNELPYAKEISEYLSIPLNVLEFNNTLHNYYERFISYTFYSPTIFSQPLLTSYLLNNESGLVFTGEGCDNVCFGLKNNFIIPKLNDINDLPWLYVLSHKMYQPLYTSLFKDFSQEKEYLINYWNDIIADYSDESLVRKLFYMLTFIKQGCFSFLYYPSNVRHPFGSLNFYKTAMSFQPERHYIYPNGKIALKQVYKDVIPQSIINREKIGPSLPMEFYYPKYKYNIDMLCDLGIFNNDILNTNKHFYSIECLCIFLEKNM